MGIRLTSRYRATAERVFSAWLDPEIVGKWLFATATRPMTHVAVDARVGGVFRLAEQRDGEITEHNGHFLEIVPHRRLVFNLLETDRARSASRVTVEITPKKRGCELILRHENVPEDRIDATKERWTGILYGLGETLA